MTKLANSINLWYKKLSGGDQRVVLKNTGLTSVFDGDHSPFSSRHEGVAATRDHSEAQANALQFTRISLIRVWVGP